MRSVDLFCKLMRCARLALILGCLLQTTGFAATGEQARQPASEEGKPTTRAYHTEFRTGPQREIVAKRGTTTVVLKRTGPCPECPSRERFLFEVKNTETGSTSEFTLANDTAQVDDVQVVSSSRTVVIGRMQGDIIVVSIIDHRDGTLVDDFYCSWPSVSDDGRFIAYEKIYPKHFTPGVSSQYLVYDLSRTPEENRPGKFEGLSFRVNVGFPVYPLGSKNRPGDNFGLDPSNVHQLASSGFFWFKNDRVLAFADRFRGTNSLVWVDLISGLAEPKVVTIPLDTQSIVDVANCPDVADKPELAYWVADISAPRHSQGTLQIRLGTFVPECLRTNRVDVVVP